MILATVTHRALTRARPGARAQRLARFAALLVTVLLLAVAAVELALLTAPLRDQGYTQSIGIDVNQYLAHAHRWLAGGPWYLPAQTAGPYVVEDITGNVYPPTLLYPIVPFALGLPMVLWYTIPVGIIAATFVRTAPAWWGWPLLALALVIPRTWTIVWLGNPAMWAIAFVVAGTRWGWPAIGATLKLTFAPLALIGVRRRSWWIAAGIAVLLALPFGTLWLDYVRVLVNTHSSRGLEYVLGEWPTALLIAVAAWSGRTSERVDRRAAADADPARGVGGPPSSRSRGLTLHSKAPDAAGGRSRERTPDASPRMAPHDRTHRSSEADEHRTHCHLDDADRAGGRRPGLPAREADARTLTGS